MQNWHLLYNSTTGQSVSIGTIIADPLPAGITALPLTDEQGEGLQNGNFIWDAASRSLIPTPPPTYSPEAWTSLHFSAMQVSALQRFEMALIQAGKPLGVKMSACKTWLEGVMLAWAMNPTPAPAESFGSPAASFEEASAEAVAALSTPNP